MKTPQGGTAWYDRFARWLHGVYQQAWARNFVGPVLIALPPGLATAFFANQAFREAVVTHAPSIASFLTENAIWVVIGGFVYAPFLLAFARSILRRVDSRSLTVNTLLRLNQALERVVGYKERRFSRHATKVGQLTKETVFC